MEAATPNHGHDPFAALTQRFAAMDAEHEVQFCKTKEVLKNGKAAIARLKKTAERATASDSPSRTRLSIKAFSESDIEIEAAEEKRHLPVTEVLDQAEVRARMDAAAQAVPASDSDMGSVE